MAAAFISKLKSNHGLGSHGDDRSSDSHDEAQPRHTSFVAGRQGDQEIEKLPSNSELGGSSSQLQLKDFELLKTLGTGTFARVWLSRLANPSEQHKDTVFALKILRKADSKLLFVSGGKSDDAVIRLKQVEHIRNERNTLAAVAGHPFITTLVTTFSDHDCLYMLLDYCPGGEVFTYLRRSRRFNESTSRFYAAEIVLVLEFLHEVHGIAYRDMKPENILIDAEGHLKLVDFGFAKKVNRTETYTLCGTPEYLAPEVIRNTGHGTAVDWWAFGILVYEFLVGQPPFWDQNPMKIYSKIVEGRIPFPQSMSPTARDLISNLCMVNPSQRLGNIQGGASRVKSHSWFRGIDWETLSRRKMKGPIIPRLSGNDDASNFDDYDDAEENDGDYTREMWKQYEKEFADF